MFTHEDRVKMLDRILAAVLKAELIAYFTTYKDVDEVRNVLEHYLTFYTRKR